LSDNDIILAMLGLIDSCLVASLMVMVTLTGYENYVSWLEHEEASELAWLGKIDTGSLKVKIASSIVAISSIHLLQVFLNIDQYQSSEVMWTTLVTSPRAERLHLSVGRSGFRDYEARKSGGAGQGE
jgi:uncharacterized protein (TIGR00645 family)